MKDQKDYTQDIAEIRSMMERSTKFLSLSGWSGIMAGLYALSGAYIAHTFFHFRPDGILYGSRNSGTESYVLLNIIVLAVAILILAIGTAIVLSNKKADKRGEKVWNAASRRLLVNLSIPLGAGGIFLMILISKEIIGLLAPLTLLFYGLALYNAGKFTYEEVKMLGVIQMVLGLFGAYFIEYSVLLWAIGFGIVHIAYGIYLHFKYER